MHNTEQLLSQTEKMQPVEVFYKNAVQYSHENTCVKYFKNTYFEEHLHTAASELTL